MTGSGGDEAIVFSFCLFFFLHVLDCAGKSARVGTAKNFWVSVMQNTWQRSTSCFYYSTEPKSYD